MENITDKIRSDIMHSVRDRVGYYHVLKLGPKDKNLRYTIWMRTWVRVGNEAYLQIKYLTKYCNQ